MRAEVRQHNGTPTLFLGEQPAFAGYLWAAGPTADDYPMAEVARAYAAAGIHLYALDVGTGGPSPEWCGPGADHAGHFDFSTVEARYSRILEIDPDASFHLRVHFEMGRDRGRWWRDLYPDECELDSRGRRSTQSFASTIWREQAKAFTQTYLQHLEKVGLVDRVLAYQVGAGHTGEWVKGDTSMWAPCGDYSRPMLDHFRTWLHRTYDGDVAALRTAWTDDRVLFDTARVPDETSQLTSQHVSFRDPRREQQVIDYYRCLAELCADLIIDFCDGVKKASEGHMLAGAFYGYLMELAWNAGFFGEGPDTPYATTQRSGHLGLARVLRSPQVDFLVSPYSYGFRGMGGIGCSMLPTESVRHHGKLYIFEDDSRTHLGAPDVGFGRAETLDDSLAILKRNMAEVLTRGMSVWWLGHANHIDPVQEPAFRPLLSRFQALGTFALKLDRKPQAEIAVIIDDESFYYESLRSDLDLPLIFQQRLWGLPRLGAPSDTYLLQDLVEGHVAPRKLYIFLNAFHIDQTRRAAIHRELQRNRATALWLYAPGYIDREPSLKGMTTFTGFRFGKGDRPWQMSLNILNFTHPITEGLPTDFAWSAGGTIGPIFHLENEECEVLGQVVYSQGRCKPGLAVKPVDRWTSIYCAVPNLPAPLLRGIARFAGVHLYSEAGDVLFASKELLGVHTVPGGRRVFTLPTEVEVVYDLFGNRTIATDTGRFSVDLPPRSTSLYFNGATDLLARLGPTT